MTEDDKKLAAIEDEKRALCADFRRKLSELLNREADVLGLIRQSCYEIEIYY